MENIIHEIESSRLDALLQFFPKGAVAIDLETTGLSPITDRIIEVAAVKVTHDTKVATFSELINPGSPISKESIVFHGITDNDVANSRSVQEVLPDFVEFLEDMPIIAHNAKFDLGFVLFSLHKNKLPIPKSDVYCSCLLSRKAFAEFDSHKLSSLVEQLSINLENHHRALDDSYACLEVFCESLKKISSQKTLKKAYLFHTRDFSKDKVFELPERLTPIITKIKQAHILDIQYAGGSYKNEFRPVKPISFLPLPGGMVLYAHCLKSDLFKSFAVKKIKDFKELTALEIRDRLSLVDQSKKN